MFERFTTNNPGIERIVKADSHQFAIGGDIGPGSGNREVVSSGQRALGIKSSIRVLGRIELALQVVVQRISVQQGRGIYHHQTLDLVEDVQVSIDRVNRLLFVQ